MLHHAREISVAAAIAGLMLVLAMLAPGFFGAENLRDVLISNIPVLIVALGTTLVILTGQIDISVGSMFAVCSIAAGMCAKAGLPMPLVALAAVLAGAALGALNGASAAYAEIPSIVATLATMVALRDGLRWITQGQWVDNLPPAFRWFGWSLAASEAFTAATAALLLVLTAWGLRSLAAGRSVYATGSNPAAARLAGIDPRRVTFWVFAVAGALTGCAAVLNAARFNQIPSNSGLGLEMKVIAAVVVGGAAITGGRGTIFGTLLGVVLLGAIGPALTFLGINAYWEKAIQGAIILTAVSIDSARAHFSVRAARRGAFNRA